MKFKYIFPLLGLTLLACEQTPTYISDGVFCFGTYTEARLYQGDKKNLDDILDILNLYSKLSDNYILTDVTNVKSINNTNEEITIRKELYYLIKKSFVVRGEGAEYFNPLCGSLSEKWKAALEKKEVLSESVIQEELDKINNSSFGFGDNNAVQKEGEALLDLGGIAKGYTLDVVKEYLDEQNISQYLINAGKSSILLGEKPTNDGCFTVELEEIRGKTLSLKNCVISTSGNTNQGVTIDGKKYSHIVNPYTGSAECQYDCIKVISETGYYGDAISTSLMMNTIDKIKEIEIEHNIKTIIIKDGKIIYNHKDIEFNVSKQKVPHIDMI